MNYLVKIDDTFFSLKNATLKYTEDSVIFFNEASEIVLEAATENVMFVVKLDRCAIIYNSLDNARFITITC